MTVPQQGYAIGIDLGTSNTVAVLRSPDGRTRPLLFDGQPILPSTVYLDERGRIHVGRDAQRMAQLDPARCEPNPKRRIDEGAILLGDREVPVVALLAAILRAIAEKAVETVGFLPPAALTHPAAWAATRRGVLTEAVRQAGWPPVRLVAEPVAAARYFTQVMRRPVPVGSSIAVFDFGGGTLDVAVVRHEPDGRYAVTASGGEEGLGGLDVDAALVGQVGALIGRQHPQIWQHLSQPESTADRRYRRLFWEDVRGAKEMLSRATTAPVPVPGADHAVHVTREELERLADPLLRRAVLATEATIGTAGLRPEELSGLFLVGGSSRVPVVGRLLHSRLGIAPTVLEQPELPVAEGALAELVPIGDMTMHTATQHGGGSYPMSGVPASGVPVSAVPGQSSPISAVPASPGGPPPGPYPPTGPPGAGYGSYAPPPRRWYRKLHIVLPAAAAVVVLAIVAGIALLYDQYPERPFGKLRQVGAATRYPVDDPASTWTSVAGGVGYVAALSSTDSSTYSSNRVWLRAVTLDTGKRKWTQQYETPHGGAWINGLTIGGGVIVLVYDDTSDSSYHTVRGGMTVLDAKSGKRLWSVDTSTGDGDRWEAQPNGTVVHYDSEKSTVTGYDARSNHVKWKLNNAGRPLYDESTDSLAGAARFTFSWNAAETKKHSSRVVTVKDGVAAVYDPDQHRYVGHRQVSGSGSSMVYNGVLYDPSGGADYSLSAYSLDDLGTTKWSKSAESGWRLVRMDVCGESLLCASETKESGDSPTAARITAWDTDTGKRMWSHAAPRNQGAIGVGNRVLVTYKSTSGALYTDVLDDDKGHRKTSWPGEAARLDSAEVLVSGGDVLGGITADSDGDGAGKSLSGNGVQSSSEHSFGNLGPDLGGCAWDDDHMICADDDNHRFVTYGFR